MRLFRALFILFLLFSPIFAEDFFNVMPSSIVHGCVDVITGEYIESYNDLATVGSSPIVLSRSYSLNKGKGDLGSFWGLNLSSELEYRKCEKHFHID